MKTTELSLILIGALTGACLAQAQPEAEMAPEKKAVIANARAYEAAFAKGDVQRLAGFFAEDAEYTADDGTKYAGRDAIEACIRAASAANKGATLAIQVDSVRMLGPDVVLEKGSTSVTALDGATSGAQYAAIHEKKEGKWKISELIETPLPELTPHDRLSELAWLIGSWQESDKANDLTVESEFAWARGGNFVTRNVTVKRGAATELEGWQIIGWDPAAESIRSWTFDTEGGFAEGEWIGGADRWLVRQVGIAPDGARTASEDTIARLGPDRIGWESNNRTLDGVPQPSIGRIQIDRVKGE